MFLSIFIAVVAIFFFGIFLTSFMKPRELYVYRLVPCNGQTKYLIERSGRYVSDWKTFDELKFDHKPWSTYSEEDGREMIKKIREDDNRFWKEYYEREKIKKKGTIYIK